MAKLEEQITDEIKNLVETGVKIMHRAESLGNSMKGDQLAEVATWVTRLGRLIRALYGEKSQYFASYSDALDTNHFYNIHSNWNAHISQLVWLPPGYRTVLQK